MGEEGTVGHPEARRQALGKRPKKKGPGPRAQSTLVQQPQEKMRMACVTAAWQTGHSGSLFSQMRLAHSMQKRLWPQGTSAAITSLSKHTEQSRLPFLRSPDEEEEELEEELEDEEEPDVSEDCRPGSCVPSPLAYAA